MTYWPWPLSAVQTWFEGIFNSVGQWIADGLGELMSGITSSFASVGSWISSGLSGLWDRIVASFSSVASWISSGLSGLWSQVSQAFASAAKWISDSAAWLWGAISAAFTNAWKWITDSASWIWAQVTQGLTWLWNTITGALGSLASSVSAFFSDMWSKVSGALSDAIKWLGDGLTYAVGTIAGYVQDAIVGVASAIGGAFQGVLEWLWNGLQWIAGKVMEGIGAIRAAVEPTFQGILNSVTGAISNAFSPHTMPEDVQKTSEDLAKNLQLTLQKLVPQGHHSMPSFQEVQNSAILTTVAFTGINIIGNVAGIAIDLIHPIKPIGVQVAITGIIKSISDNVITAPIISIPLEAGVYRPLRYHYNAMNPNVVPGSGDLIRFVVREVIDLKVFYLNMLYQGYDQFWGEAFWEAHFELPGLGVLIDAYHRGTINEEEINKYVFWHDYKPDPRPGIKKTDIEIVRSTYKQLIPRVDLRYAWESGALSDEELVQWYRRLGYEEDAELMAQIQIERSMVEEITKVRTEWLNDFIGGYITEETLRSNLAELGMSISRIDYYVTYAAKSRARGYKKGLLGTYQDGYIKDLVTDEELAARAGEILVDPEALDLFLRSSYVSKYKKPKVT
jgi:hypothetical protein